MSHIKNTSTATSRARAAAIAIFHASTSTVSRSAGRSAIAAAAYRAGAELIDARTGQLHDYTRRGGVVFSVIALPDGGSCERNALWNAAEAAERRKDARTAREWIVALPSELDATQRQALARAFGQALVDRYGVAVDIAVHLPDREGDHRNHHAHVLTTTRQVTREGERLVMGDKATIELSDTKRRSLGLDRAADDVTAVRQLWEQLANAALTRAGRTERIDCRRLEAQGIDREATQHLGPVASDMERRGKTSDRGDGNRQAQANNAQRQQLTAQVIDLQTERHRRVVAAMPAEQLVTTWDRARTQRVAEVRQRADGVAVRIEGQVATIRKQRQRRQIEHAKDKPSEPQGLFAGIKRRAFDKATAAWAATAQSITAWKQLREADLLGRLRRIAGYLSHRGRGVPDQVTAKVERVMARKLPIEAARLPQARAEVDKQRVVSQANDRAVDAFTRMALKRESRAHGYTDRSDTWNATPEALRRIIDRYNEQSKAQRERMVARMRKDPHAWEPVAALLLQAQRQQQQTRGLSR